MKKKQEEVLIIAFTYAAANPYAVVVESFNAVVAFSTVRSPKWAEDVASVTKSEFLNVTLYANVKELFSVVVVFIVKILKKFLKK
jgi:hypothetical protein